MTIQHSADARNAMVDAVTGRLNVGSLNASGRLQLAVDSGFADIVVSVILETTAFAPAVNGSATLNLGTGKSATYGGVSNKTVAWFRFVDRDNVEVWRGTVSGPTGQGDVKIASTLIQPGDKVSVPSYTYTTIL